MVCTSLFQASEEAIITSRQVRHGEASVAKLGLRGGQRRQQGAAFTPEAMDSYLPRVEATCRAYLDRWARQDCIDVQEEVRQELHDLGMLSVC